MLTDEFREIKFALCPRGIGLIVEGLLGGFLSGIFFHKWRDCLPILSNLGHFSCCRVYRW